MRQLTESCSSSVQANELGYDCASSCPYVKERKRAMKARVVIMTYQLYHYMINIVSEKQGSNTSFKRRNIIFCDECHNIPKILTSCFTPELKLSEKHNETMIKKYGSKVSPKQREAAKKLCSSEEFKEKRKRTCLRKYGTPTYLNNFGRNSFKINNDIKRIDCSRRKKRY